MRHDRRSQAVRLVRSKDPKEREQGFKDYPELKELVPIINLVRSGFGNWNEMFEFKEKHGIEKLLEIQNILSIIEQEEDLELEHIEKLG